MYLEMNLNKILPYFYTKKTWQTLREIKESLNLNCVMKFEWIGKLNLIVYEMLQSKLLWIF